MPIRLSLAILIAAGVTAAQQDPSSQASKGTVVVRVLDAATGQPISGASVGAGDIHVRTGADGGARLENLSTGARWVNASADGYLHGLESSAPRMFDRMVAPPETDPRRWAARNP